MCDEISPRAIVSLSVSRTRRATAGRCFDVARTGSAIQAFEISRRFVDRVAVQAQARLTTAREASCRCARNSRWVWAFCSSSSSRSPFTACMTFNGFSGDANRILRDNYDSLVYCKSMLMSLDDMRIAAAAFSSTRAYANLSAIPRTFTEAAGRLSRQVWAQSRRTSPKPMKGITYES